MGGATAAAAGAVTDTYAAVAPAAGHEEPTAENAELHVEPANEAEAVAEPAPDAAAPDTTAEGMSYFCPTFSLSHYLTRCSYLFSYLFMFSLS